MRKYFCNVWDDPRTLDVKIGVYYVEGKELYVMHGGDWVKVKEFDENPKWTMVIPKYLHPEAPDVLTSLVDGLISCGAKPTKPVDNPSELKAVRDHLEDMRSLVFKMKPRRGHEEADS